MPLPVEITVKVIRFATPEMRITDAKTVVTSCCGNAVVRMRVSRYSQLATHVAAMI